MFPEITIDLAQAPEDRWQLPPEQIAQARGLVQTYNADLGGAALLDQARELLQRYVDTQVPPAIYAEITGLAQRLDLATDQLLLANLHYDAIKFLGCSAFAVDTPDGPVHARNLDWWTENQMLSRFTMQARFIGAPAGAFTLVTWPGFIGALSAIAPERFTVTLNAVSSTEAAAFAPPSTMMIREVLETAATFDEAVEALAARPIMSDCLLLVTGTKPGEMVVIERTPTQAGIRQPADDFIVVTNDYLTMAHHTAAAEGDIIEATSCGRFEAVDGFLRGAGPKQRVRPMTFDDAFGILRNPYVQMEITVQQMCFCAATGDISVRPPDSL